MAPKSKINAEMISEVSYEILKKEGEGAVNARSIASGLECSTQPIYSYFKDMNELISVLLEMAKNDFIKTIKSSIEDENPFLSLTSSYIRFAHDNKNVFKFLFFSHYSDDVGPEGVYKAIITVCPEEKLFGKFSKMNNITSLGYMEAFINVWSYVHGVASLSTVGHKTNDELFEKTVLSLLRSEFMRISFGG